MDVCAALVPALHTKTANPRLDVRRQLRRAGESLANFYPANGPRVALAAAFGRAIGGSVPDLTAVEALSGECLDKAFAIAPASSGASKLPPGIRTAFPAALEDVH